MTSDAKAARAIYRSWFDARGEGDWSQIIEQLNKIPTDGDPSGEVDYIYGLLVYDQQCELDGDTDLALDYFVKATTKNSSHYMAHLYAGHCHHDKARHKAAIDEYRAVDTDRLKGEYPIWRFVKLIEQQGECLYHLDQKEEAIRHFDDVLGYYQDLPIDDLVDPQEIYRALAPNHPIVTTLRNIVDESHNNLG